MHMHLAREVATNNGFVVLSVCLAGGGSVKPVL